MYMAEWLGDRAPFHFRHCVILGGAGAWNQGRRDRNPWFYRCADSGDFAGVVILTVYAQYRGLTNGFASVYGIWLSGNKSLLERKDRIWRSSVEVCRWQTIILEYTVEIKFALGKKALLRNAMAIFSAEIGKTAVAANMKNCRRGPAACHDYDIRRRMLRR